MNVLVIDPGPHVGLAFWTDRNPTGVVVGGEPVYGERHTAYEQTPLQFSLGVADWIEWADVVVVEGYRIGGARAKEANITIEMIGVVRYLATRAGKKFYEAEPGAYRVAGGPKLKKLGWYTPGSDHARSASGHLVKFLIEHGLLDGARLLP